MNLYIKNMVCDRCIMAVKQQFEETGIPIQNIRLGEVETASEPDLSQIEILKDKLVSIGFELLDDKKARIVEQIKMHIIRLIQNHSGDDTNKKISVFLSEKTGMDYHYLSSLFSSIEGITIEKYVILQRIEKAKELLFYNEMSLNDIAFQLGYSSVQHLSGQFKNVTGMTPSQFKKANVKGRKPIDKIGKEAE